MPTLPYIEPEQIAVNDKMSISNPKEARPLRVFIPPKKPSESVQTEAVICTVSSPTTSYLETIKQRSNRIVNLLVELERFATHELRKYPELYDHVSSISQVTDLPYTTLWDDNFQSYFMAHTTLKETKAVSHSLRGQIANLILNVEKRTPLLTNLQGFVNQAVSDMETTLARITVHTQDKPPQNGTFWYNQNLVLRDMLDHCLSLFSSFPKLVADRPAEPGSVVERDKVRLCKPIAPFVYQSFVTNIPLVPNSYQLSVNYWHRQKTLCIVLYFRGVYLVRRCDNGLVNIDRLALIGKAPLEPQEHRRRVRETHTTGSRLFRGHYVSLAFATRYATVTKVVNDVAALLVPNIKALAAESPRFYQLLVKKKLESIDVRMIYGETNRAQRSLAYEQFGELKQEWME